MVEAVIVLPLLIFLLAAGSHMATLYQAKQKVLVTARGCAWQYADGGCQQKKQSEECTYPDGGPVSDEDGTRAKLEQTAPSGIEKIGRLPLIGSLIDAVFGTTTEVAASREVEGRLGDDEPHVVAGRFFLMCNEEPRTGKELAKDIFNDLYDAATN